MINYAIHPFKNIKKEVIYFMRRAIIAFFALYVISQLGFSTLVKAETVPVPIFDLNLDNYNITTGQGATNEAVKQSDIKAIIHKATDTSYATTTSEKIYSTNGAVVPYIHYKSAYNNYEETGNVDELCSYIMLQGDDLKLDDVTVEMWAKINNKHKVNWCYGFLNFYPLDLSGSRIYNNDTSNQSIGLDYGYSVVNDAERFYHRFRGMVKDSEYTFNFPVAASGTDIASVTTGANDRWAQIVISRKILSDITDDEGVIVGKKCRIRWMMNYMADDGTTKSAFSQADGDVNIWIKEESAVVTAIYPMVPNQKTTTKHPVGDIAVADLKVYDSELSQEQILGVFETEKCNYVNPVELINAKFTSEGKEIASIPLNSRFFFQSGWVSNISDKLIVFGALYDGERFIGVKTKIIEPNTTGSDINFEFDSTNLLNPRVDVLTLDAETIAPKLAKITISAQQ